MKKNRILIFLLCFAMLTVMAGCGAAGTDNGSYNGLDYGIVAPEAAMDSLSDTIIKTESTGSVSSTSNLSTYTDPNAKLIRTVRLDAQTQEYDALIPGLEEKISALGGYIESRDAYNGSIYSSRSNRYCNMVVRIPADRLGEFVTHVNESANVTNTSETVENITLQYVDTAARIEALEAERDRLLELLAGAMNLSEILEIEARLSDVSYELESYASQLRLYDNLVDYATVHLNIEEVQKLTPVEEPTVWTRISEGFVETLEDVWDHAVDFFVWFVVNLPRIVIWGTVIACITFLVAISSRKKKARKKAAPPPPPPQENAQ